MLMIEQLYAAWRGGTLTCRKAMLKCMLLERDRLRAEWRRYVAKRLKENPEHIRRLCRESAARNPETIKRYNRERYNRKKPHIIALAKIWEKNNPDKKSAYGKKSRARPEVRARRKIYDRAYKIKNREMLLAKQRAYETNRRRTDPIFRMVRGFRTRLYLFASNKLGKKTWDLLGCDSSALRAYLESKFKQGMNWLNHGYRPGNWVVDHILPVASFDHTNHEEVKKCWHFSNLQPLWYEENAEKRDRILA